MKRFIFGEILVVWACLLTTVILALLTVPLGATFEQLVGAFVGYMIGCTGINAYYSFFYDR